MRRSVIVILASLGALAASSTLASAHRTPFTWTVTKARVTLQEDTNIRLPEAQRAALDAEITAWLAKFRPLLLTAQATAEKDPLAVRLVQTYDTYITRFTTARFTVNTGLSIDTDTCNGVGKALVANFGEKAGGSVEKRYRHFRCNATSYVLEIPNIELKPGADPALPEVVEGPRRLVGPFQAVYSVHVTGKSRMLAQRAR